jgi:hypothetical protein
VLAVLRVISMFTYMCPQTLPGKEAERARDVNIQGATAEACWWALRTVVFCPGFRVPATNTF